MRKMMLRIQLLLALAALGLSSASAQEQELKRTIWDGIYTAEQAERGRNTYLVNCSRCHSEDFSGLRQTMVGEKFMEGWSEDSVYSLFHRIQSTMPPGRAGTIEDQDYIDIVAFFFQQNEFPTGEGELVREGLEDIRIQSEDGPTEVPSFSMVRVVGCLAQDAEDTYRVTSASRAVRVRDPGESTGEELEAAKAQALGDKDFELLRNVIYLEPENAVGSKVEIKGFLIRDDAGDRVNVSTLQVVGNCGQ